MHPEVAKSRARVAGLHGRPADDPERVDARRELIAAKTAAYIEKVLDGWPPLTGDQRTKLAELLKPVRVNPGDLRSYPPPTATAVPASGGSTSTETRVNAAHLILDNAGVRMSPSKVSKIVRDYERNVAANGFDFFHFLANAVQLSAEQQRAALSNPDVAKAISYADPTGETAVRNVLRQAVGNA